MTIFLIVGLVGLALLILSFILDGVFDAFEADAGGGIFSATALTAMLAAFGFTGVIGVSGFGLTPGVAAGIALVVGVIVDLLVAWLTRALHRGMEGPIDRDTIVGSTGAVITPVPGGSDWGEISVRIGGQPMKMSAVSETRLEVGTAIRITAMLSSTGARVVALEDGPAPDGLPPLR